MSVTTLELQLPFLAPVLESLPRRHALCCSHCQRDCARTSKIRWTDLIHLFLLRRPYRCGFCTERFFGFIWSVL
jgi:hypothetical protein